MKNTLLTLAVSIVLAVVILIVSNAFVPITDYQTVLSAVGTVFVTMKLVYEAINAKQNPAPLPASPEVPDPELKQK
jgi:FtsH-binding integral membrane protein